ncbi:hypothetical protein ACPZ19_04845 [Amycolatopsis lurida]
MNTPNIRQAQEGEVYVALADTDTAFPAMIDEKRWNGFVKPHFTRDVVESIAAWLTTRPSDDRTSGSYEVTFDGDTMVFTDTYEGYVERIEPGPDQRYPLGAEEWVWDLSIPASDVAADAALLADTVRLASEDGEILVTIGVTGTDPLFPALPDPDFGWSRAGTPRFRPDVAEVVVAWLNDVDRRCPGGGVIAYWDNDTLVLLDRLAGYEDGYLPTRIARGADGRYPIGGEFEWERPASRHDTRHHGL